MALLRVGFMSYYHLGFAVRRHGRDDGLHDFRRAASIPFNSPHATTSYCADALCHTPEYDDVAPFRQISDG